MGKLILPRRKLLTLAAPAIISARSARAQFVAPPLFSGGGSGGACDPFFADVSLLCHFDQSNGATTLVDSSSNAQSVLCSSGSSASTAQFEFGTASLLVNGGNTAPGGADSLYEFGSGAFTVEAWAYWDGTSATNFPGIVAFWPGFSGTEMWSLVWNRGSSPATLAFNWSTDGSSFSNSVATSGAYTPAANTWISYACDRSGNTFRLYVNGAVVATQTASDTIFGSPSLGTANIGNWGNSSSENWTGYIDEVRVTKGVARYAGAYTPATGPFPNC
jgi:hypothetical protein